MRRTIHFTVSPHAVRRRTKVAIIGIATILAFIFLIPVVQVSFARPPMTEACASSSGQLISGCAHVLVQGYGSITYWLFGTGGFYGTLPNSGYGLTL